MPHHVTPLDPLDYGPGPSLDGIYDDSWETGSYTWAQSSLSCVKEAMTAHLFFGYMIAFTGFGALVTRVLPDKYKWIHKWMGRGYILSMFWCTATAIMVHNYGQPMAIIWSFFLLMVAMTLGYVIIGFHQSWIQKSATERVTQKLKENGKMFDGDLSELIQNEKKLIIAERSVFKRIFSSKGIHGFLMAWSYFTVVFRSFTAEVKDFKCHTQPVLKPINSKWYEGVGKNLSFVPSTDPRWFEKSFSEGTVVWVGRNVGRSMMFLIPGAILFSYMFYRLDAKNREKEKESAVNTL